MQGATRCCWLWAMPLQIHSEAMTDAQPGAGKGFGNAAQTCSGPWAAGPDGLSVGLEDHDLRLFCSWTCWPRRVESLSRVWCREGFTV